MLQPSNQNPSSKVRLGRLSNFLINVTGELKANYFKFWLLFYVGSIGIVANEI